MYVTCEFIVTLRTKVQFGNFVNQNLFTDHLKIISGIIINI